MKNKITLSIIYCFLLLTQASAQMTVTLSVSPNDTICQGQSVTFTATVTGCPPPFTAYWYVNSILFQASTSLTFVSTPSNFDCFYCEVSSASATCQPNPAISNMICPYVVPNQPPSVSITAIPNPVCLGDTVVCTATATDAGGACATYTWYVDGIPDLSSTTAIFNYLSLTAGVHAIFCEVHSCDTCDIQAGSPDAQSNMVVVSVVLCIGIASYENNSFLKIFPNPTNGKINLQWENQSGAECEIFISDYIGKTISEFRTKENSLSIENAGLKSGVYFVTIKTGEKLFRSPVVIY